MKNRSRKLNNHVFLEKENRNRDSLRNQLVNESQLVSESSREILEEYDRLPDWKPSALFLLRNGNFVIGKSKILCLLRNSYFIIKIVEDPRCLQPSSIRPSRSNSPSSVGPSQRLLPSQSYLPSSAGPSQRMLPSSLGLALRLSPLTFLQPLKEIPNHLIVTFDILSLRGAAKERAELVLAHFHFRKRKDLNNVFVN